MSYQTVSERELVAVLADPPTQLAPGSTGTDVSSLLTEDRGSGALELFLVTDTPQDVANVRFSTYESGQWAVLAQAGVGDRIFAGLTMAAGVQVRVTLSFTGRPTHVAVSADFVGALTAQVARVEGPG